MAARAVVKPRISFKGVKNMQKSELIAAVAKSAGVSQTVSGAVINAALDAITASLKAGDKVTLTGFGTFEARETAARTGTNPRTKEKIKIAAGKRASFSAGSLLKEAVSGKKSPSPSKKAAPKKK